MKVLLSSVFGPYGVDDQYGRRLNVMELFHNQVTREQGIFSLRMNHPSFGLYLIAENLEAPAAVLDFPSLERFIKEVRKGYDVIGISFIVANFEKARKMASIIRELSPATKIVLGGHGINISGIEKLIDFDYISSGEGVSWFRRLLGEDVGRPVRHPAIWSTVQRRVMGIPLPPTAAVLIPGLGCVNACSFCATSHHFGKKYIGYLNSGKELFDTMCELEKQLGCKEFFVMDENFLKNRPRAEELLAEMERQNKFFYMGVFSSAETINAVGVEFMAKLGIDFVWVGVESKQSVFQKTKGVDVKATIRELRDHGIQVLGSAILFMDHHTSETMQEDIDYVIDLNTDFVQFMELGPLPGTELYREYEASGKILSDVPYPDWHGQDKIWFRHDHFSREETQALLKDAFQQEYERQGASLLRLLETSLRGYRKFKTHGDRRLRAMTDRLKERCLSLRVLLPAALRFAENDKTRQMAVSLANELRAEFGSLNFMESMSSQIVNLFALREKMLLRGAGYMPQPPTRYVTYRMSLIERLGLVPSSGRLMGARHTG
ncbi:MAG TPA: B12-binding domain-containing radical SAM protein [Candidatus Obscuribacterales bacterium]